MRRFVFIFAVFVSLVLAPGTFAADPLVINLWPGQPPDENGHTVGPERVRMSPKLERKQVEVTEPTRLITAVTNPTLTIYRPARNMEKGTAMLICPGGGYWDLYWQLEVEDVAVECEFVGVSGLPEEVRCLPDQVEREIGEAEVDLEHRRVSAPFTQALAEDQRIVAEPLAIIGARRIMLADRRCVERPAIGGRTRVPHLVFFNHWERGHQICFTTSGMS